MACRSAAGLGGPGLHELGLGLGHGELLSSRVPPAWIDVAGTLAAFQRGGGDALGGVACTSSTKRWRRGRSWQPPTIPISAFVMELLKMVLWSSYDRRCTGFRVLRWRFCTYTCRKGTLVLIWCFFARSDATRWCGRVPEIHGKNELLTCRAICIIFINILKTPPGLYMISIRGYANFAFFHMVQIIDSGYWSILHDAQSLERLK